MQLRKKGEILIVSNPRRHIEDDQIVEFDEGRGVMTVERGEQPSALTAIGLGVREQQIETLKHLQRVVAKLPAPRRHPASYCCKGVCRNVEDCC